MKKGFGWLIGGAVAIAGIIVLVKKTAAKEGNEEVTEPRVTLYDVPASKEVFRGSSLIKFKAKIDIPNSMDPSRTFIAFRLRNEDYTGVGYMSYHQGEFEFGVIREYEIMTVREDDNSPLPSGIYEIEFATQTWGDHPWYPTGTTIQIINMMWES